LPFEQLRSFIELLDSLGIDTEPKEGETFPFLIDLENVGNAAGTSLNDLEGLGQALATVLVDNNALGNALAFLMSQSSQDQRKIKNLETKLSKLEDEFNQLKEQIGGEANE